VASGVQHGGTGDVGRGVEADVLGVAGAVDHGEGDLGAAVVGEAGALVVRDVHAAVCGAADLQGLLQGLDHLVALVAHVSDVERAVILQHRGNLDQFLRRRGAGRRIEGAGRKPERAVAKRHVELAAHGSDLAGVGGAIQVVHNVDAQGAVADQAGGVHGGGLGREVRVVLGEAGEAWTAGVDDGAQRRRQFLGRGGQGCDGKAAVAVDDTGDALADRAGHLRFGQQRLVIMGVWVDEARRQDLSRAVDGLAGAVVAEVAHLDDAVVTDREVSGDARRAAAVDDLRVLEQYVYLRHRLLGTSSAEWERENREDGRIQPIR